MADPVQDVVEHVHLDVLVVAREMVVAHVRIAVMIVALVHAIHVIQDVLQWA